LQGLNDLFQKPLTEAHLARLATQLGSDVPFFLQSKPALATGRGEQVQSLDWFPALRDAWLLLIHPGFGIPTAWAYQSLKRFPQTLPGQPGRAERLIDLLQTRTLAEASGEFYNSLEAPAFEKYPILALYQQHLRSAGASASLMSGSGSTTFALVPDEAAAMALRDRFRAQFGPTPWIAVLPLGARP
jgi:4-diphosphocytidyl-2-C-methyl-D-erythritol kinase